MSDEKDPTSEPRDERSDDPGDDAERDVDGAASSDEAALDEQEGDEADEADELDGLDEAGFDAIIAQARDRAAGVIPDDELDPDLGERPYTQEEAGLRSRVGWGRSPIISAAVVVIGLFLLAATWSDFRYFLRSGQSAPRDLGDVSDIFVDGAFTERLDNEWVVLEGDPDVQHAARMQGREGWIGFMRLIEADANMFVAIPRATQNANNEFPGRFEGRMRRIDEVAQFEKLQTFFNAEEIVDIFDLAPEAVADAISAGASEVALAEGGTAPLARTDKLRVVVAQSAAVVQLGRTTWPKREAADAAITALGLPWAFVEKRGTVWVYAVEVGTDASVERYQELTRALNGGEDLDSADPKVGGLALPRRATYLVDYGDLQVEGAELSFTYGDNTAGTGWTTDGGDSQSLRSVELVDGRLRVPLSSVEAYRLERSLRVNPDGYLLMVDQRPFDVWPSALMFGAVLGVVLLNGWALAATLRRRREQSPA